ncbi:MAG: aminopeptidase [Prevotellaceae bacterium]|nr:aminopeptidase [Prevotellaceae bacterium]
MNNTSWTETISGTFTMNKKRLALLGVAALMALGLAAQNDSTLFMQQLCALEGISDVKPLETSTFKEKYVLKMEQQVDWKTLSKGTLKERIIIGMKGLNKPTIIVTEGYFANYGISPDYEEELSRLFDANVILCEYRYFAESVPQPTNWDYMTVDNSLADYHHVRQTMGQLFTGKWISTGISKGGQTTMFYRATYPDDVDVSVSYVAPLNRAIEDGRHEKFLAKQVGTKAERKVVKQAMQEFMKRKKDLMPLFHEYCTKHDYHFYLPEEDIYDYCVLEYPFALWQWGTPVSTIPSLDDDDNTWFSNLMNVAEPDYFRYPNKYMPFDVQAIKELGYYGYSLKPIKKWTSLKSTKGYLKKIMLPDSLRHYDFDATLYKRTVKFLKKEDPTHIFIYGEIDPWSASGVCTWLNCKKKKNMRVYVQPRGSHGSRISNMPEDMKAEIIERLTKWLQ